MHHRTDRITHTTAFVTPVVAGTFINQSEFNTKGKKEKFYLMMHSQHFIYDYMV